MIKGRSNSRSRSNYNHNRIIDLRIKESAIPEADAKDSFVICSHCEISMIRADEDVYNNGVILVNKDQYYCKKCGLVKDTNDNNNDNDKKSFSKKRESTGPKIKRNNENIFFKIFRSAKHTGHKPTFLELDDERTENILKGQGCIIGNCDERKY